MAFSYSPRERAHPPIVETSTTIADMEAAVDDEHDWTVPANTASSGGHQAVEKEGTGTEERVELERDGKGGYRNPLIPTVTG